MISKDKNTVGSHRTAKAGNGHTRLLALILKKGKRDITHFKNYFGKDPDFPSVDTIRKSAWK